MDNDPEMTPNVRAVRLVNTFIERHRLYLKDGGPGGMHKVPKSDLISMIEAELEAYLACQPPAEKIKGVPAQRPTRRQPPSKPKALSDVDEATGT